VNFFKVQKKKSRREKVNLLGRKKTGFGVGNRVVLRSQVAKSDWKIEVSVISLYYLFCLLVCFLHVMQAYL
jgi:hypothetical protein